MVNPIYLLVGVVSAAALAMLGINLYLTLSRRREKPDETAYLSIHQRLDAVTKLVSDQLEANRQSSAQASLAVHQQVQSFTKGMTELRETVHNVHESVKEVATFQSLFKSAKHRGSWGELTLGAILKEYFPHGGYTEQHTFASGEIVDAVLKLPNDLVLPIDSKFSWDNFQKMTEAQGDTEKAVYRKQFLMDIKKRIDEIATKYILPSEGTVDMALMYMPAESIYYEVIQNITQEDVAEYARKRKVYLTSPNTLYITLSAVIHWFKDAQLQKQTRDVMKKLETVIKDSVTLADDFRKLGDHLSDAQSAFERSDKRLGLLVDRTQRVIALDDREESRKIEPPVA